MNDHTDISIGRRMSARREHLGISQEEVARRMTAAGHPWGQATYWKSARGQRKFLLAETPALALALEVPMHYLLGDQAALDIETANRRAGFLAGLRHSASTLDALARTAQR